MTRHLAAKDIAKLYKVLEKSSKVEYGGNLFFKEDGSLEKMTIVKGERGRIIKDSGIISYHTHPNTFLPSNMDYYSCLQKALITKEAHEFVVCQNGIWLISPLKLKKFNTDNFFRKIAEINQKMTKDWNISRYKKEIFRVSGFKVDFYLKEK